MASIEHRTQRHTEAWRVIWRENGTKQYETFADSKQTRGFQLRVEAENNHWPRGWVKGRGFVDPDEDGTTFRQWAEMAIRRRTVASERTKADYRRDLERHVYPNLGDLPLERFGTEGIADDIVDWLKTMRDKSLSGKTIHNIHGMTSSILNDAMHAGRIPRNPMRGTLRDGREVHTEEMVFLLPGEVAGILHRVPEHYRPLATVLYGTGLRWSESTALQVHDVDLLAKRPVLHVRRAWKIDDDGHHYLGEPKTRRARRTLRLSPELVDVLVPLVASSDPGGFVFTGPEGRPVRHNNFYTRVWLRAVALASVCERHAGEQLVAEATARKTPRPNAKLIKPVPCDPKECPGVLTKRPRIHDLRHSHASLLINEGIQPIALQRRLGHSSITTTYDRYGHLFPDSDDAISDAVDRALVQS